MEVKTLICNKNGMKYHTIGTVGTVFNLNDDKNNDRDILLHEIKSSKYVCVTKKELIENFKVYYSPIYLYYNNDRDNYFISYTSRDRYQGFILEFNDLDELTDEQKEYIVSLNFCFREGKLKDLFPILKEAVEESKKVSSPN